MKKTSLKAISGLALTAVLFLALAGFSAAGQNNEGNKIEGTWRVALTMRNCLTGETGPTLQALNTFIAGGSMIGTPSVSPALLRTGHGVWEHDGPHQFKNTIVFFRYNPDGTFAGTQKVTRHIELVNNDEFTSVDSIELVDPGGNVGPTLCATGIGQRLEQ